MQADISLNIHLSKKLFADPRRIRLLQAIQQTGSISQGAKLAAISYKTAWDAISDMNTLADNVIVERNAGGKGGGGAHLTRYGERLIQLYQLLEQIQQKAFDVLQQDTLPLNSLLAAIARFSLQTSARNQLFGHVTETLSDGTLDSVTVLLSDGQTRVRVAVTRDSSERLCLSPGKEVLVLVKAPWMQVHTLPSDEDNQFPVTVTEIVQGENGDEILMQLANGETLCAGVPAGECHVTPGQQVWAGFLPQHALLASLN